ncbi:DEAD/DEAH box helicase [Rhizobium leguminosarum]|uniref:DEAD/DEAH box helicase n=1 Tax=Rhizobium leguminosarum TaxID=384 RepID=UPI0015F8E59E|nr:DEAD/DEAH box helicase [Rhizobium leguminosarum]MBA8836653.1 superfamily II DNA or RNA helicase [Rhizobium leguminosarum]
MKLEPDQLVRHEMHGEGFVVTDLGPTVVVRFDTAIQQVERASLSLQRSLNSALRAGQMDDSLAVLCRAQALAISSVNDQWGVFSRSRVQLLPHQLWVCRQVTRQWPIRWLVADDVGLGKTIEAGLILEPLIASGRVRRVLVLAPARLVPQWRARMKTMFDIRLQEYTADSDRGRISFWETAQQVVASFHTLRMEKPRKRLLQAEPWDLVIVDEAHHFQAQERAATLTYGLLSELANAGRIGSLVLFTGTPHRGKDFGFLALMQLLRPDLFNPEKEMAEQLSALPRAMIRNNKALVTDLEGNKLFRPVETRAVDYSYSEAEEAFYHTMSEFILDGRAYAASLSGRQQTARMLLLIALQKLAASSISAITRALRRRRAMLVSTVLDAASSDTADPETLDEIAEIEESRPGQIAILLMQDEIARLDEIIALADEIADETKIATLLDLIENELPEGEPVLLFTEYKATQALVHKALEARFGRGCVGFINGDERLVVSSADGVEITLPLSRDTAADDFNAGRTRFLISTEAGGEGIDLQERCAVLVHVDMPWNPMRLHQRVGRLNRYGQKRAVSVFLLRNPRTVEARIWALLQEKLTRIQATLSASMDEPEDISLLVIGMAGNQFFDELYAEGSLRGGDGLSVWFDQSTQQFGGRDAVETVRAMLGNVARYDFQSAGAEIPKLDLPALEPFFRNAMSLAGRRVIRGDEGLSVATPEVWRGSLELRDRYDALTFDRFMRSDQPLFRLLGVGHPLLDRAVAESTDQQVFLTRVGGICGPLVIAQVEDEITGTGATVHRIVIGIEGTGNARSSVQRDWELLLRLNNLEPGVDIATPPSVAELLDLEGLFTTLKTHDTILELPFRRPKLRLIVALLPERASV